MCAYAGNDMTRSVMGIILNTLPALHDLEAERAVEEFDAEILQAVNLTSEIFPGGCIFVVSNW